jgi:DNA processing protein
MFETQRILRLEEGFPPKLRELASWPDELQVHGCLRSEGLGVAIVGARAAHVEGMRAAQELASDLARGGARIISGGALGIDAAAHRGALCAGGYTMAIMACGLDGYYPRRNAGLFEAVLESGGAMVSPFALGQLPKRSHFVRRNQVIAALADLVVIVEASTGSGSLHTARYAAQLGRKLAAFPGSPGCEALLARGVPRVGSAADVMDLLAGREQRQRVSMPSPDSPEALVLARLSPKTPLTASQVAAGSDYSLRQTQRILCRLELSSLVLVLPGRRYLPSPLAFA